MKKITLAAVTTAALLASGGAMAQAYIGASAGMTQFDVDCTGTSSCDDSDTGFKVYGGYGFGNGFAVEGVYFNHGKTRANVWLGGSTTVGVDIEGTSVGLGVAVSGDFSSRVTGTARLGIASNTTKVTASYAGRSASEDEKNTSAYFGLALGVRVATGLSIEGGIDFTPYEFEGEKMDSRLFSVGLKYAF